MPGHERKMIAVARILMCDRCDLKQAIIAAHTTSRMYTNPRCSEVLIANDDVASWHDVSPKICARSA